MTRSKNFPGLGRVAAILAAGSVLLHATNGAIAMPGPGRQIVVAPHGTNSTNNTPAPVDRRADGGIVGYQAGPTKTLPILPPTVAISGKHATGS